MFDMMKMLGKMKEVQEKVRQVHDSMKDLRITGEAAAGMVKATMDGQKRLLSIEIDPNLNDRQIIQDLIVAAVNAAMEQVDAKTREVLHRETQGLVPNIPGLDLGAMFGK